MEYSACMTNTLVFPFKYSSMQFFLFSLQHKHVMYLLDHRKDRYHYLRKQLEQLIISLFDLHLNLYTFLLFCLVSSNKRRKILRNLAKSKGFFIFNLIIFLKEKDIVSCGIVLYPSILRNITCSAIN